MVKKIFKKWWVWVLVILFIGGILYVFFGQKEEGPKYITERVQKGLFTQTVEVSGMVEAIDKVDLGFKTNGSVQDIFVEVGDQVQAGDLLMTLKNDELFVNVEKARQALRAAQALLDQKIAGSTYEAIQVYQSAVLVAQANVGSAKVNLENAQAQEISTGTSTEAAVNEAQRAVLSAEIDLENILLSGANNLEQIRQDFLTVLESNMIVVRSALSQADEILGIDNTTANNDYETILSNLDQGALDQAEASYKQAKQSRDKAESLVFSLTSSATFEEIDKVIPFVQTAIDDTTETLLYTHKVIDATSLTDADFTPTELTALKTSMDSARKNVQSTQDLLLTQSQLYQTTIITNKTNKDTAEQNLLAAQQALVSAKASKETQDVTAQASVSASEAALEVAQADLAKAEANLAQVIASPREVDLESLRADVERYQAELAAAQIRFSESSLYAPITGSVTAIKAEEGESITSTVSIITIQTTQEQFQVVADIPESDIAKVSISDHVKITFDAFGNDKIFEGMIGKINPAEKNIENVIYYEVTVYLDINQDQTLLKPGMSADLEIRTDEREDILSITQRALLERDGMKYVRVLHPETIEERFVTPGIRGDNGRIEIQEGLNEGEEIIITTSKE